MRACSTCQRLFDTGAGVCPDDGTPLGATDPLLGRVLEQAVALAVEP
jgi:hypothetical protein